MTERPKREYREIVETCRTRIEVSGILSHSKQPEWRVTLYREGMHEEMTEDQTITMACAVISAAAGSAEAGQRIRPLIEELLHGDDEEPRQ
ncbi:hypothetical protein GCM10029978_067230 [Actinoallomurus acanthiterrae]